jgi:NAD+ synthase
MTPVQAITADVLRIDARSVADEIASWIQTTVFDTLRRRGAVVGLSGGVDSSVVAALCARALGTDRVIGLLMPEADSSAESLRLGRLVAGTLGISTIVEDITPILLALGCYRRRDAAIASVVYGYKSDCKCKLVLSDVVAGATYPIYSVVVQFPDGAVQTSRLSAAAYSGVVSATNFKQRTRKMLEYYHADLHAYGVAGTPNLLEYDQGFFVKNGDGAADFKPIAHLYKSQVYQLAEYLGIPGEICTRPPTTETYSMEQSQEEFYFSLPYPLMDLCLYAKNNGLPASALINTGLTEAQAERAYRMIDAKRRATRYLHAPPLLMQEPS